MAYIIQQRRDTLENWNSINPILAESEIGFILDLDENGKQKSSLYKIGDGKSFWTELPLFGWGGNVYNDFIGSDLTTSLASRQAILDKVSEIINGSDGVEGLVDKLSNSQLIHFIDSQHGETDEILKQQVVSRYALLEKFQNITSRLDNIDDKVELAEEEIITLREFAEVFDEFKTDTTDVLKEHTSLLNKHNNDIYGWEEERETGETDEETGEPITETIKHKGIVEDIQDIKNKFQIISEDEYNEITDFSHYAEGTVFLTYEEKKEE